MPNRARVVTIGAAVAASALVAGVAATSASADSADGGRDVRTLRFQVETSPLDYTDLGAQGPSVADVIVFHDTLFKNGRQVGHEVGSCTFVEPDGLSNCTGVITLDRQGTITFAFENAPPPEKTLAITGGSGDFGSAEGDGTLVENGDGTGTLTLAVDRD